MSLLFSLLMKADATQAKAELRALSGEVAKGKTEVAGLGAAAASADGKVDGLGAASGRAAAQNDKLAQSSTRVKNASQGAAGSVGNLVAQFNDIGMMIAAGQNPLQLAIQQGTQITQVIGPMGAAGAVKSLGGAFLSALSPINMITLGVIGFGSAAIQWLMGGEEAALSLTDALEGSASAISDLKKAGQIDLKDLRADFGAVTSDVVEMQEALTKLASVKAFQAQQAAVAALKAETEGSWWAAFTDKRFTQGGQIADVLGTDWLQRGKLVATDEVADFRATLESLETARGPRAQLEVFQSLQAQMIAATGGIDQMTMSQMAFYEGLVQSERQIRQNIQAQREAALASQEAARAAGQDDGRMGAPLAIDLTSVEPAVRESDVANARELLSTLEQEASVRDLINQYGRDSENVALARLEAERAAFVEMAEGLSISDGLRKSLIDAWDAANGLASARIAAAIEAGLGPAGELAKRLWDAAAAWSAARAAQLETAASVRKIPGGVDAVATGDVRVSTGGWRRYVEPTVRGSASGAGVGAGSRAGRGGGGASSAREEKDAVAELIAKLREEQQTMQETDPVKREMLKYRKQLADASKAEQAEVEGLIQSEMRLKSVQAAREYASDAVGDFLDQIIAKGGKASDVIRGLAAQFFSMAARSMVSGEGWFAQILGVSGGLFGKAQAKASGGMIYGEGGPRADKVPVWASAGEFMINARSTARYRPLLERINAGGNIAGFANGGMIGGARGGFVAGQADRSAPPSIINNFHGVTGNSEIRQMVDQGVRMGLKQYNDQVLPDRVAQISRSPRDR